MAEVPQPPQPVPAPAPVPTPPPQPEHQTLVLTDPPPEKHHTLLYALCVVAVALVTGGLVAYWGVVPQPESVPEELVHTYTNTQFGYSIKYPGSWSIKHESQRGGITFDVANPDAAVVVIIYSNEAGEAEQRVEGATNLGYSNRQFHLNSGDTAVLIEGESDFYRIVNLIYVNGSVAYEFFAAVPPSFYDSYADTLIEIARSFYTFSTTTSQSSELPFIADPETFTILNKFYGKDIDHVYGILKDEANEPHTILEADPASFQVLTGRYAKDNNNVFWNSRIVAGADPISITSFGEYPYAKDKNKVYWRTWAIYPALDPDTFMPLANTYVKDAQGVYFVCPGGDCVIIMKEADVATFVATSDYEAEDKNHKYLHGEIVE